MSETFLAGKNILVVDDEKFCRSIVVRNLRDYGEPFVDQAASGAEALAILCDPGKRVDAVILDFVMPGVTGLTVLKAIRTGFNGIRRDLPVVMLTGNSSSDLVSSALMLDVDAFVVKPVSKVGLSSRLAKALASPREMRPVADYQAVSIEDKERKSNPLVARPAADTGPGRAVSLDEIQPGAVLARDIQTAAGAVLLAAGTTLSERYLGRLRELLAVDRSIAELWVS